MVPYINESKEKDVKNKKSTKSTKKPTLMKS